MEWSELEGSWILEDWNLKLIVREAKCTTIMDRNGKYEYNKPVTDLQKSNHKLYKKLGRNNRDDK